MTDQSAACTDDPIDRDYLERNYLALGCGDVLTDVIKIYLESYPLKVEKLQLHLSSGSTDDLIKVTHGLKGESGSVGARMVMAAAAAMEKAARQGNLEELRKLMPMLELELTRVAEALKKEFLA